MSNLTGHDDPERQFEVPSKHDQNTVVGGKAIYSNVAALRALPVRAGEEGGKGSPPAPRGKQIDSRANSPRDLVAVIDAMLAEIPENDLQLAILLWRSILLPLKAVYREPVSDRDATIGIADALVKHAAHGEPWYDKVMAIWCGATEFMSKVPGEVSPVGDADELSAIDFAEIADTVCVDCGSLPQLILLAQDVAKCVRCFILAGMNSRCFQCGKNPTEAIVRAINPKDEKEDTVGTCIDCLMKHISAGRN